MTAPASPPVPSRPSMNPTGVESRAWMTRRVRATRSLWLGVALVLASIGQLTWLFGGPVVDGAMWYVLGVLAFLRSCPDPADAGPTNLPVRPAPGLDLRGMVLLLAGAAAIVTGMVRASTESSAAAFALPYVTGLLFILAAALPSTLRSRELPLPSLAAVMRVFSSTRALAAIVLLAAVLRLIWLDQLPFGIWFDEALIVREAAQVLADSGFRPLFSHVTETPSAFLYTVAGSVAVFGQGQAALRLVSAVAGVLTVVAWYALLREGFPRRIALSGALLMAVSRWDLTFSRLALQGVTTPLFEVTVMALLLAALRRGSLTLAAGGGLLLGIGMMFYVANLAFLLVVAGYVVYRIVAERSFWAVARNTIASFTIAMLLAGLPVFALATLSPDLFWRRTTQVSMLSGEGNARDALTTLAGTAGKHLLMFHQQGDRNGRHNIPGEPMLDPLTGVLTMLGFAWSVRHWKRPFSVMGLLWLVIMLLPAIFSLAFEAPQGLRAIGALPAVLLFAAVGMDRFWQTADTLLGPERQRQVTGIMAAVLALIAVLNIDGYFRRQAGDARVWGTHSTAETIIGHRLAALPDGQYDIYVSGLFRDHPATTFFVGKQQRSETFEAAAHLPLSGDAEGVQLFLEPKEEYAYQLVRKYYPQALCEGIAPPAGGAPILYACAVSGTQIRATRGLDRTIWDAEGGGAAAGISRNADAVLLQWGAGEPLTSPLSANWTGTLHAPQSGRYGFRMAGDAAASVVIDQISTVVSPGRAEAQIELAQGLHTLGITAKAAVPQGFLRLHWQPPGQDWQPLPSSQVSHAPIVASGLTGSYFANPDWSGLPAFRRIEPALSRYFHLIPLPRPYSVEWSGSLTVTRPGLHRFSLTAISTATFLLEGRPVLDVTSPGQTLERELALSAGIYPVRLRFRDQDGYSHVYLHWAPPGEELHPIPPEVLRPW